MGSTGSYNIAEVYSSSSVSKSFKYEIEEATLADPFAGSNPLTLYQYSDVALTINAVTSSSNIHPGTGSSAIADTVNAEYYSLGEPSSGTSARDIALEFFIYRDDSNDDVGDTLTPTSTGPTDDDFTYNPTIIKTATATDNTTAVTLASGSNSIIAGMVVTSDSIGIKGTETAVTVSSISDTALVLSSSQAIPVDEELTFSPPLEWDWDVLNVAGAAAADTTATGSGSTGTVMTITAANTSIKEGMHITGTNMHANASVTVISSDGLTITMSDTSSGTMSGTYTFLGAKADGTIYVYKVTADIEARKYGTDNLTSQLKVDNFLTPTAGSGGGGASATAISGNTGANLTSSLIDRHMVNVGNAGNGTYSGTVALEGNWDGNSAEHVTPALATSPADVQIATVSFGAVTFTSGYGGGGVASGGSTTGTSDYVITLDGDNNPLIAADITKGFTFSIDVGLVTEP